MTDQTIKFVIAGVLFVHGLGHIGPLAVYMWIRFRPGSNTTGWLAARSWLFPSLPGATATAMASLFWVLSLVGFVAAGLGFCAILVPAEAWRQLAVASVIVSLLGIAFFLGTSPVFNTLAALGVNFAVLVTQLLLQWPPQAMFGK
jgi:hypothetical protein